MEILGEVWNSVIIRPMINSLVLLYAAFFANFGVAIILFTIIVRAAMIPLSLKQSRSMKAMTSVQPKMKDLQERYKNDRQKLSQETMKLYREHGINPVGCLGPLVVQMPIFLGLFWALRGTLPSTPERLADLSGHLYSFLPMVHEAVPLDGKFLWLNLAEYSSANPIPFLLPVLVGVSMFVMQKMTTMPSTTPQQESTNRMMLWLMPGMFGVFTLNFEAGLALYWIVSNIVGIVIQGFVTGWSPLVDLFKSIANFGRSAMTQKPAAEGADESSEEEPPAREADKDENDRDDGQDGRRSNRNRPKGARRRAPGRRNRRR